MATPPRIHGTSAALTLMCGLLASCGPLPELTDIKEELANEEVCATSSPIALGQSIGAQLSIGDCMLYGEILSDRWSLNVAQEMSIRVDVTSPAYDALIELRDESDYVVAYADDFQGPSNARIIQTVSAGSYSIVVGRIPGQTATGEYQLSVEITPPCQPGSEIGIGETLNGDISDDDCFFEMWAPADSFTLVVTDETPLRIHMKSTDFEPLVVLRNQQGWDEAHAYDEMGDGNARAHVSLAPGTYSLFAIAPSYPQEGAYELTVSEVVCEEPESISPGQSVTAVLNADDCVRLGGAYMEPWQLVLTAETAVRIDMKSQDFDAWLELRDAQGSLIETNDDGGSGVNSRIDRTLAAGTYLIEASAFGPSQTGSYVLTVGALPAPRISGQGAAGVHADAPAAKPQPSSDRDSASTRLARLRDQIAPRTVSVVDALYGSARRGGG